MKKSIEISLFLFAFGFLLETTHAQNSPNTITFDNQSGEFAIVKLMGPTKTAVEVPNGESKTVHAEAGDYYLLGRYGTHPGNYKYTKGDPFKVSQPPGQYSAITITLHKVIQGNYHEESVSGEEFESFSLTETEGISASNKKPFNTFKTVKQRNLDEDFLLEDKEIEVNELSIDELRVLAKEGNPAAQTRLGDMYRWGIEVKKNEKKAIDWYTKATAQEYAPAMKKLGDLYSSKVLPSIMLGVPKSKVDKVYEKYAFSYYQEAADLGDPSGQYALGNSYYFGKGVKKNIGKALEWYEKSSSQGYSQAMYTLGTFLIEGRKGVPKNEEKAVQLFQKAAELDHSEAQRVIGDFYRNGHLLPKDSSQAIQWYRKAARKNVESALISLAEMYANGEGVMEDKIEAYKWAKLATRKQGYNSSAGKIYNQLLGELTPEQIEDGDQRSNNFRKTWQIP